MRARINQPDIFKYQKSLLLLWNSDIVKADLLKKVIYKPVNKWNLVRNILGFQTELKLYYTNGLFHRLTVITTHRTILPVKEKIFY